MMIMMLHLPFILSLFALGMGVCIYIWSLRNKGAGIKIASFFGIVIIALSLLSLACIWYTAYNFKSQHQMPMMQGDRSKNAIPQNEARHPGPRQ